MFTRTTRNTSLKIISNMSFVRNLNIIIFWTKARECRRRNAQQILQRGLGNEMEQIRCVTAVPVWGVPQGTPEYFGIPWVF